MKDVKILDAKRSISKNYTMNLPMFAGANTQVCITQIVVPYAWHRVVFVQSCFYLRYLQQSKDMD